jgi:hypothetical protein
MLHQDTGNEGFADVALLVRAFQLSKMTFCGPSPPKSCEQVGSEPVLILSRAAITTRA